jgi:hypothetical protein
MSEESQKLERELKAAFAYLYPLASEHDLPWAPCHIADFLRKRIEHEVHQRTESFTRRILTILCEVAPNKTHIEDMVRIVVERAKASEKLKDSHKALTTAVAEIISANPTLRMSKPLAEKVEDAKRVIARMESE